MSGWIATVVVQLDRSVGRVVLVGHSGGGNVVWGAADARADKVARVIFVDTVPPPPDSGINQQQMGAEIDKWGSYADEYRAIYDVTVEMIGSGHWPQFSQPDRLAALINEASIR